MSRPNFSAALIASLRERVIAHNESSPDKVTLNQLKKLYERAYKGEQPAERAMRKVDEHLDGLAKAFDPSKHPRKKNGQFGSEDKSAADHVRAAAGAAADAAGAAAEGVRRGVHHAAYYAGVADEPLKPGVKAPKKVPLNLPADRDQHRQLQAENAGYNAFTSDVIPEQRGAIVGGLLTAGISGAGGLAVAHLLTSKNPHNVVRRGLVRGFSVPVGVTAKVISGIPLHTVAAGVKLAESKLGVKMKSSKFKDFAASSSENIGHGARRATAAVVNAAVDPARWGAARFIDAMEGKARVIPSMSEAIKPGERLGVRNAGKAAAMAIKIGGATLRARSGRAAATTALALVPAYFINRALTNSPVSPIAAGQAYDSVSYRVVQKVMTMPELEGLAKDLTSELRKSASTEAVENLFRGMGSELSGKLFGRIAGNAGVTALGSAAGSSAGALVGAGANASVQAVRNALQGGNPYHDKDGKFTSKENAVNTVGQAAIAGAKVGGAVGALAGGGFANRMIGRVNRRLFHSAMSRLDSHIARQTGAIEQAADKSAFNDIADLHGQLVSEKAALQSKRDNFIESHIAADKTVQAVKDEVERYGGAGPLYYGKVMRDDLYSKLATMLTRPGNEEFMLPAPGTGTLTPLHKLVGVVRDPKASTKRFLENTDEAGFARAIANLPRPAVKEEAIKLFAKRADIDDQVEDAIKKHLAKIDKLTGDVKAKAAKAEDLKGPLVDAQARFDGTVEGSDARAEADAALKKATDDLGKATKSHQDAISKLQAAKNDAPELISPFDGSRVRPPNPMSSRQMIADAEDRVRPAAEEAHQAEISKVEKKYKTLIQKKKNEHFAALRLTHARELAIAASLGHAGAGMSRIAGKNAEGLLKAKAVHDLALNDQITAEREAAETEGALNQLTEERKTLPRGDKGDKARSSIDANIVSAKAKLKAAQDRAATAKATRLAAQPELQEQAERFKARYDSYKAELNKGPRLSFVPPAAVKELARDIGRAARAGYDPVSAYALKPTAAGLKKVMSYVSPQARSFSNKITGGAVSFARGTVMSAKKDPVTGEKTYELDPLRIGLIYGTGALGATGEFLHASSQYLRAKAAGDAKAKPPTTIKAEIRRHPTKAGEALIAIHAADPRNKGERIVLFGHQYKDGEDAPTIINPGARLSDVLNAANQGGSKGAQQPEADWLGTRKKEIDQAVTKLFNDKKTERLSGGGGSVQVRKRDDNDHNNAAASYMAAYREKFLADKDEKNPAARAAALEALFSKQSPILKPSQMHTLLTGYTTGGEQKGSGVLKANEDFKSGDAEEAKGALADAVDDVMKANPKDSTKEALRKAVIVIGHNKKISPESLAPIFDKIDGGRKTEFSKEATDPEIPVAHTTAAAPEPEHDYEPDFSARELDQADGMAAEIAPSMGITTDSQKQLLAEALAVFAGQIARAHDFSADTSVRLAGIAMQRLAGTDKDDHRQFKSWLKGGNVGVPAFRQAVDRVVSDHQTGRLKRHEQDLLNKLGDVLTGGDLDDLEALVKRMPGITAPQQDNGNGTAPPGVSKPQEIKIGGDVARNFEPAETRGLFRAGQRAVSAEARGPVAKPAVYHPIKDTAAAAGDIATNTAVNQGFKVLPKVKGFGWTESPEFGLGHVVGAVSKPVATVKNAAKAVTGAFDDGISGAAKAGGGLLADGAKLAAKGVIAGALGATTYTGIQALTDGASYRKNTTPGETLGLGAGNAAGVIAGETALPAVAGVLGGEEAGGVIGSLAGPVGTIAGGAIGGALGEFLAHKTISKYFSGYNPKSVKRVMGTKPFTPAPGQSVAATAGEVGGGVIGNALGGSALEGAGGAIGSSLGVISAQAKQLAQHALSRRPKQSQGQGS